MKILTGLTLFSLTGSALAAAPPNLAQEGFRLFRAKGCFECHGTVGQGNLAAGPQIAPGPPPLARFGAYVRKPAGRMPPYSAALLSDGEVEAIHAYLVSIPRAKGPQEIPMLAALLEKPGDGAAAGKTLAGAGGREIYRQHCAACHGETGRGGAGPDITGEGAKRSPGATAQLVREPPAGMPRLYPAVIDAEAVEAVSSYVRSLSR